ncbi:MAG: FliM/FliN family flagellar motor switch protein [Anaerolineaceae bacterium]|jgi:flagellar motor switch protein FliM
MLTQSEIDALLSGTIDIEGKGGAQGVNLADLMNSSTEHQGPESEKKKKIQAYNFWSPDRFSKEQMRAVELIHEDLAERLTTSMPTFLRTNIRPRLVHTEQGRFNDFLADFPESTLFHIVVLSPLPGQTVLTLSPDICTLILEQRLGGKVERKCEERQPTDIDQSLLRGLIEHMLGDIKAAWSKVVNIEPALEDSTVNQHWVQMVIGNERAMMLTYEITIQGHSGTMSFFVPFSTLKPILNVLNPHIWISGRREQKQDLTLFKQNRKNLEGVPLDVKVILGEIDLAVQDVLRISVGDILQLGTSVSQPLLMQISDQRLFLTKVGKVGNRLGVQISSAVINEQKSEYSL